MKKPVLYYVILLFVMVSFTGCAGTGAVQKPDTTSIVIDDANKTQEILINTEATEVTSTIQVTPTVTTGVTPTPESTPEPTLKEFDIDEVVMQSTPDSSCFSEVGYDPSWNVLVVRFLDSGSVYKYLDFPADEWDKLMSADSLGDWYNKHIKGIYKCEKAS